MRLLVVDDDVAVRMQLAMAFDDVEVIDGFRAADVHTVAKGMSVDAVVLDRRLPDGDGLAALRQLRNDPATAHLPVIVITADDHPVQRHRAFAAGADEHLYKPLEPAEVHRLVHGLLATSAEERRVRRMLHRARMFAGRDDGGVEDLTPLVEAEREQPRKRRRWRAKAG